MKKQLEIVRGIRKFLLQQVADFDVQQLNQVPPGFNNNIIWNIGHLISVQQNLCYVRSGLRPVVDQAIIDRYLPGTKPEGFVNASGIDVLKKLLIETIDRFESDLGKGVFATYTPSVMIPKVYGFEVPDVSSAVEYLLYHEGLHGGCVQAMKTLGKNF